MIGQVVGGFVGSLLLIRVKATFVRFILIGLLFFSAFSLITKGLYDIGVMGELPVAVFLTILALDAAAVFLVIIGKLPKLNMIRR